MFRIRNLSVNITWNLFHYRSNFIVKFSGIILCINLHQQRPLSPPVRPAVVWHETVSCTWYCNGQCAPSMISLIQIVIERIGNKKENDYYLIAVKRM